MIPSVGGGLCQLSNALYELALRSGFEIVERHAHSQTVPGSAAAIGRDATVAWQDIDLRFRSLHNVHIRAFLTASELVLQFWFEAAPVAKVTKATDLRVLQSPNSCLSCGQVSCGYHAPELSAVAETTAWIVNIWINEWSTIPASKDAIYSTVDGKRFGLKQYEVRAHFQIQKFANRIFLHERLRSRIFPPKTPAESRSRLLQTDVRVANDLSRLLLPEQSHLVVSQSHLPTLWQSGALGGRTFDVLLERLPIEILHQKLDEAFGRFQDQMLLADFRASEPLVIAEREALEAARYVYSHHPGYLKLFGNRGQKLSVTPVEPKPGKRTPRAIIFPGPTAARKGAYLVRSVAIATGLPVISLGKELEGPDFWKDCDHQTMPASDLRWLEQALVVLQPSISEDSNTTLRNAVAAGIPVLGGEFCGLEAPDFKMIDFGDLEAAVKAVQALRPSP